MKCPNRESARAARRNHYQRNKADYKHRAKLVSQRKRREIREYLDNAKNKPCADCGNSYPPYVMQFDHVTGEKEFNLGNARGWGRGLDRIIKEVAKCEVVCANCRAFTTNSRRKEEERSAPDGQLPLFYLTGVKKMDNQTFLLIAFLVVLASLIWGAVGYMIGYKKGRRAG